MRKREREGLLDSFILVYLSICNLLINQARVDTLPLKNFPPPSLLLKVTILDVLKDSDIYLLFYCRTSDPMARAWSWIGRFTLHTPPGSFANGTLKSNKDLDPVPFESEQRKWTWPSLLGFVCIPCYRKGVKSD